MQTADFIAFLKSNNIPVFTIGEATKILRCNKPYAKLFLYRCIKNGLVGRVEKGIYYLKERHNEYEIASHIISPSYISMASALAYYGLTTQIPRVVYVISEKQHPTIKNFSGFDIIFKKIKRGMMFGYHKEPNGNVSIADPEKAIVDIYYFNDINDLDTTVLDKPPRIDIKKLVLYAQKSKKRSVIEGVNQLLGEDRHMAGKNPFKGPNKKQMQR